MILPFLVRPPLVANAVSGLRGRVWMIYRGSERKLTILESSREALRCDHYRWRNHRTLAGNRAPQAGPARAGCRERPARPGGVLGSGRHAGWFRHGDAPCFATSGNSERPDVSRIRA